VREKVKRSILLLKIFFLILQIPFFIPLYFLVQMYILFTTKWCGYFCLKKGGKSEEYVEELFITCYHSRERLEIDLTYFYTLLIHLSIFVGKNVICYIIYLIVNKK